ncbi:MAG TPA: membrane protein insertase YidC [Terriglobales bacterium]|nr:membrane protein insertase YidC [Terriglobales bacterium]
MPDFQNPQQDPGMERRLLLTFALTFLVILLFQPILKKYLPQAATPPAPTQTQTPPAAQPEINQPSEVTRSRPKPQSTATKQASSESTIVIESDLYQITFTNRGAQVKSWILKKFNDEKGQPLELVNQAASEKYGYPLSLWMYDETQRNQLNSALFVTSATGTLHTPVELSFEYANQGTTARKSFRFDDTYAVQVETSVTSGGNNVTAYPMWPAGLGDETNLPSYASGRIEYQFNNNVERLAIKKISSGNTLQGPFNWAGTTDQYFAVIFLPDSSQNAAMVTLRNAIDIPKDPQKPNPQETTKAEVLGVAVGNPHGPTVQRMFVGPKSLNVLESVPVHGITGAEPDLRALIDFGWWGVFARPLFIWLKWTYANPYIGVHNWGWAIVVQTLIINLALMPLRISQTKYALKMQKIQPQIKAIQERYKKYSMRDPRKQDMQKEIFALQQKEGVSMWGGCLPMLVQFPFLIAYYRMLGIAIDLRQAHWLWIHDLSSADPYLILPILIIITGLLMQRMTPQAGIDPSQQKMMNVMMPMMFGIISFRLAAGLCLYWCESSLIGIAQQMVLNRTSMGIEMREIALKRARKKEKKQ